MMKVSLIMGSDSDFPIIKPTVDLLKQFGIESEVTVASAHRTPDKVRELVQTANERNVGAFIVGAGAAAHLAGIVAAYTAFGLGCAFFDGANAFGRSRRHHGRKRRKKRGDFCRRNFCRHRYHHP